MYHDYHVRKALVLNASIAFPYKWSTGIAETNEINLVTEGDKLASHEEATFNVELISEKTDMVCDVIMSAAK